MAGFDYGKEAVQDVSASERIVLHGVKTVFATKNPNYKMLSIADKSSETGFCSIPLPSACFRESEDGTYNVLIGNAGMYRVVNLKKDGVYVKETRDVSAIEEMYKANSATMSKDAAEKTVDNRSAQSSSKTVAKAYLNMVPLKLIEDGKEMKKINVPVSTAASDTGFAHLYVSDKVVYPCYNYATKKLIPGRMNVCLGAAENIIQMDVMKNGTLETMSCTAAELSDMYRNRQKEYASKCSVVEPVEEDVTADDSHEIDAEDFIF